MREGGREGDKEGRREGGREGEHLMRQSVGLLIASSLSLKLLLASFLPFPPSFPPSARSSLAPLGNGYKDAQLVPSSDLLAFVKEGVLVG